jgi:Sulfotransferase family
MSGVQEGAGEAASPVDFSEEAVLEEARRATGLSDFGDPGFREGLRVLLGTYAREDLTERGRRRARRRVLQLLSTRLRVQDAWLRHPEIRQREIRRPLYLTGLPRTGTSALFNLLGVDPAARPLLLWEGTFPDPLEDLAPGQTDPRYAAVKAYYQRSREKNPEFTRIHFADADTPEECVLLLAHDFCDVQLGVEVLMEPYGSWFQRQDLHRPYAYYRDLLKMLDWQRPGERWLLKSPAHLWALDVLVEMFPDVCIAITHRDPRECVGSYCSMMAALMDQRRYDPRELGPTVLEYLARSMERAEEARARLDARRFLDVRYGDFVADPMAAARRIYAHFELPLASATEAALEQHVRSHPQGRHGAHEYGLEEYGLTPERVLDRLRAYVRRYQLA